MTSDALLAALERALAADPRNGALWLHFADQLEAAGRIDAALDAVRSAAQLEASRAAAEPRLVDLLVKAGKLAEALIRAEALLAVRDDPALRVLLARIHELRGDAEGAAEQRAQLSGESRTPAASTPPASSKSSSRSVPDHVAREPLAAANDEDADPDAWADQFDWGDLRITFADVVGLEDVKRNLRLRIIAPFQNPAVYEAFGRGGGGGILLYGPPGCGKTFIARATAGELGARFVSVSIHDIVDKYWGESEKAVHALFEQARRNKPAVLFFDEFDALGGARGSSGNQFWRTLVDQLLQEMDGIAGKNKDVLVFAATNTPWAVDSAFRRPGRFDRTLLVAPPDAAARKSLLERALAKVPGGSKLELGKIVQRTELFTSADMVALVERAAEPALERSLETGKVHELVQKDLERAAEKMQSTAAEWFATARNYARYANEGGQFDELSEYLKSVKKW